jgi:F1F0 ATPase subunit 2
MIPADTFGAVCALLVGALLGLLFFGGLWWTVRHAATFRQPGLAVFTSLLLRTGLTLAGFYAAADGHWQRLLWCLAGFVAARVVLTHWTSARP